LAAQVLEDVEVSDSSRSSFARVLTRGRLTQLSPFDVYAVTLYGASWEGIQGEAQGMAGPYPLGK
jgi:hypothetical protein